VKSDDLAIKKEEPSFEFFRRCLLGDKNDPIAASFNIEGMNGEVKVHHHYSEILWPKYTLTLCRGWSRVSQKNENQEKNDEKISWSVFFHGSTSRKEKAGLPVIRQPGCPLFPSGTRGFPPTDCSVFGFC
jgi:hypothetical protein